MGVYDRLSVIARPEHVHGVRTPEDYAAVQLAQMKARQDAMPGLGFRDPWDAPDGKVAWIAGGKWIVTCTCGNAPAASPEWDIARCLECGAIYRHLTWPTDRQTIEAVLIARPSSQRAWMMDQTVEGLREENVILGVKE